MTSTAGPTAPSPPAATTPGSETSSDDEYELVGADTVVPAPPTQTATTSAAVDNEDIEALMALAEFASAPPVSESQKKRPRLADTTSGGQFAESSGKKKPKPIAKTPSTYDQQSGMVAATAAQQTNAATIMQQERWRAQQLQQQQIVARRGAPPATATTAATAAAAAVYQGAVPQPATTAATPRQYVSVMPAHNRCSRHVAIAYFIYYQQRASIMKQQGSRGAQVIMDPTLEARRLKEKSEWLKRSQQQVQVGADGSVPPGSQYMMGYSAPQQTPFASQQQFTAQQHAYQMSMMQQPALAQQYMAASYGAPYYAPQQPTTQQQHQLASQYMQAYAAQQQSMMSAQHLQHLQQQQHQQAPMQPGGAAAHQPSGQQPDQLHQAAQNAYAQHMALAQARFSATLQAHQVQTARQTEAARQSPTPSISLPSPPTATTPAAAASVTTATAASDDQQQPQSDASPNTTTDHDK